MRLCITKKDIAKARLEIGGINLRATCCPVAQSLKRRGFPKVLVGYGECWLGWQYPSVLLPAIAKKFTLAFDAGRRVSPITFTIEKAAVAKC